MPSFLDEIRRLSPKQLMLLAYDQHERLEALSKPEPIAIIGMGCRFPGAENAEAFWELLTQGRDAIGDIPPQRWDNDGLFDPDPDAPGRICIRQAGFIADVDAFDSGFFGIAPREAQSMDPQQRLLLEVAWQALEDAGLPPDQLANTATGVFVGQGGADYVQRLAARGYASIDGYFASGNSPAVTSGRLAYCLGLQGPTMTIDTSCSSSLVALHLACRSLRSGESEVALAGGVNVICAPEVAIAASRAHMLAPDGRSKAFAADADGFGRGEGCGVVVLKRLTDALAAGDVIRAVIRGSAVNQDGRSAGLTVPNGPAQEAVIVAALRHAGVAAGDVTYVEAHGTGTALGDPIEARALSRVFGEGRPAAAKLLIGSVKTNIGHLEAAAGVAGVIKTALCLSHGRMVPSLHCRTLSTHIPWDDLPIAVATSEAPWPEGRARLAGVSSFGFSGTNAHVVLEAPPVPDAVPPPVPLPVHCLPLSARSPAALRELAVRYAALLEGGASLAALAREASRGRSHHSLRLAVTADEAPLAAVALRAFAAGQAHPALLTNTEAGLSAAAGRAVFLFGDDGMIDSRVARALYESAPAFRDVIDAADAALGPDALGHSLAEALCGSALHGKGRWSRAGGLACQCAMAALWQRLGISPAGAVGQGLGAIAASITSGSVTLTDGLRSVLEQASEAHDGTGVGSGNGVALQRNECATVLGFGADPDTLARAGSVLLPNTPVLTAYPGPNDSFALMRTLAALYVRGAPLAWAALGGPRSTIRLPAYPFERQRYWVALPSQRMAASTAGPGWPGTRLATAVPVFETWLGPDQPDLVRTSRDNRSVVTEAKLLEFARSGVRAAYGIADWAVGALRVDHELALPPSGLRVQLHLSDNDDGPIDFAIYSQRPGPEGGWQFHARGQMVQPGQHLPALAPGELEEAPGSVDDLYYQVRWRQMAEPATVAHPLPSPSDLRKAALATYEQLAFHHRLDEYDQVSPLLHELSGRYTIDAFRALGFDDAPGRKFSTTDELSRLRIVSTHRRLFARLLTFLEQEQLLQRIPGGWHVRAPLPESGPDLGQESGATLRAAGDPVALLRRCGARLADVLTGSQEPLALLFPNGSLADMNAIYADTPAARVHNGTLAAAIRAAAAALPDEARLRILEVGGGTAGSTEAILSALPAERVDYTFTDVSQLFLDRARTRFPALRTGLLNIENDPDEQGYAGARFDLVVAANVLHATADLATAVRHCRRLLAPGGLLLCLEAVVPERWGELTFGMTEGWWRFTDVALRPEHPLVSVETWRTVLAEAGFVDVHTLGGEPGSLAVKAQQAVLVARSPAPPRRWQLVGGPDRLRSALVERLRQRGDAVTVHDVTDDPACAGDGDLVYLGALALGAEASGEACAGLACADAARWLAALARGGQGKAWLVTAGAHPVAGGVGEAGRRQAPLWGTGRVFALEEPGSFGGLVDLPADEGEHAQIEALLRAVEGADGEDQVAYRGGTRHVARLERASVPVAGPPALDPDATYLVIGGFGGLGLLVGRWLAGCGARHIALLGRTPDMASDAVRDIEAAGVRIIPLVCDIADAAALRETLARFGREDPPLRGLIHAATAGSMAPIAELTPATVAATFRSKVDGMLALEAALPASAWATLDFVVLFSSTAALTGGAQMAAYAAANAFLDATAHGTWPRLLTINWGMWEVIRASASDVRALDEAGLKKLSGARALQCMQDLIAAGVRQMTVADIAWDRYKTLFEVSQKRPLLADVADRVVTAARGVPSVSDETGSDLQPEKLEPFVRGTIARTLGLNSLAEVPLEAELFQLGMDSLMAMQVRATLANQISVDLPLRGLLAPALTVGGLLEVIKALAPTDHVTASQDETVAWEEGVL